MSIPFKNVDNQILRFVPSSKFVVTKVKEMLRLIEDPRLKIEIENFEVSLEYTKCSGAEVEEALWDMRESDEMVDMLRFFRNFRFFDYLTLMDAESLREVIVDLINDNLIDIYAFADRYYVGGIVSLDNIF